MATVASVYDLTPVPRSPTDIMDRDENPDDPAEPTPAPNTKGKWVTASVAHDATAVVATMFEEAQRRDPERTRTWVALVDGNNHQIDRIKAEAKPRGVTIVIVIGFVHVREYLWSAAWSFFDEVDNDTETWVYDTAMAVLDGHATRVAAAIRRKATYHALEPARRSNADKAAHLPHQQGALPRLRQRPDQRLAHRHGHHRGRLPIPRQGPDGHHRRPLSVEGAEAVLKLRALISNGDFNDDWRTHLEREHQRVHQSRYADGTTPQAA